MYGRPIKLMPAEVKGVTLGWEEELRDGEQVLKVRVWDPVDREYYTIPAHPRTVIVDKETKPLDFSRGDWERIADYVAECYDLALDTHDEKWFKQLCKLQRLLETERKRVKQMRFENILRSRRAREARRKAGKKKGVGVMQVNGIYQGATILDTTTGNIGIALEIIPRINQSGSQMVRVSVFDRKHGDYIIDERRADLLKVVRVPGVVDPPLETKARTDDFIEAYFTAAGELAVNTHDCEWFEHLKALKRTVKPKTDSQ